MNNGKYVLFAIMSTLLLAACLFEEDAGTTHHGRDSIPMSVGVESSSSSALSSSEPALSIGASSSESEAPMSRFDSLCGVELPVYAEVPVLQYSGYRTTYYGYSVYTTDFDASGWIRRPVVVPGIGASSSSSLTSSSYQCDFQIYDVPATLEYATRNLPKWQRQLDSLYRQDYCILAQGVTRTFWVFLDGVGHGADAFNDTIGMSTSYPGHGGWGSLYSIDGEHPQQFVPTIDRGLPIISDTRTWPCSTIVLDTANWPVLTPEEFLATLE